MIKYEREIWQDIVNYTNLYKVSSLGNIINARTNKLIKPFETDDGYLRVGLSKLGIKKNFLVHRLVATAFMFIDRHMEVDHLDFNRKNNSLTNLEWVSGKENICRSINSGRHFVPYNKGNKHGMAKLSDADVLKIRELCITLTQRDISNMYSISQATISLIKNKKSWSHI